MTIRPFNNSMLKSFLMYSPIILVFSIVVIINKSYDLLLVPLMLLIVFFIFLSVYILSYKIIYKDNTLIVKGPKTIRNLQFQKNTTIELREVQSAKIVRHMSNFNSNGLSNMAFVREYRTTGLLFVEFNMSYNETKRIFLNTLNYKQTNQLFDLLSHNGVTITNLDTYLKDGLDQSKDNFEPVEYLVTNKNFYEIKRQYDDLEDLLVNGTRNMKNRLRRTNPNGFGVLISVIVFVFAIFTIILIEAIKYDVYDYLFIPFVMFIPLVTINIISRKKDRNLSKKYLSELIRLKEENKEKYKDVLLTIEDKFAFLNEYNYVLNKSTNKNDEIYEYSNWLTRITIISHRTLYFDKLCCKIDGVDISKLNSTDKNYQTFLRFYKVGRYYDKIQLLVTYLNAIKGDFTNIK